MATTFFSIVVTGLGLYLVKRLVFCKHLPPLPQGPPGFPLIGNIFDLPSEKARVKFVELTKKYGDIYSMNMLGTQIVVLNSTEAASHILGRHSAITSNRPHLTMANDLVGWKDALFLTQYGERFRRYRRLLHHHIGSQWACTSEGRTRYHSLDICSEVQKRAQAELDAVVGIERLPTFEDRDALPYINAIFKEVLRWYVVTPLGTAVSRSCRKHSADD